MITGIDACIEGQFETISAGMLHMILYNSLASIDHQSLLITRAEMKLYRRRKKYSSA